MVTTNCYGELRKAFAIDGSVWSDEVVKPFPFFEGGFLVNVTFGAEKLMEFLLIRSICNLVMPPAMNYFGANQAI